MNFHVDTIRYFITISDHIKDKGKTPSEACGIKIEEDNKWVTLIQNAKNELG